MLPLLVLVFSGLLLRLLGAAGVGLLVSWTVCLRGGLAVMFLVTASAHWGKRRQDLIVMVPPVFPRPELFVTVTGMLEILGVAGLLIPALAPIAATCLAILLLAMFPANVRAARENLKIGDRAATKLPLRTVLQVLFMTALILAGFPNLLATIQVTHRG